MATRKLTLLQFAETVNKATPGLVYTLSSKPAIRCDVVSTGSILVDMATGIGGFPRGRIVEIYGPESSGKTTLALSTVAQGHAMGIPCLYVDYEHALSISYANQLGVKTNDDELFLLSQPDDAESGLELIRQYINALDNPGIVVVDSVAAMAPRAEIEGEIGDAHVGLQARMMSQALRLLVGKIKERNVLVIFINQLRSKIGGMTSFGGSNEMVTGGNALKFYASMRCDVRRIGKDDGDEPEFNKIKVTLRKNKLAPPFREAETKIFYNRGFDVIYEQFVLALKEGLITKRGSYYYMEQKVIGQGEANAIEALRQNPSWLQTKKEAS